MPNLPGNIVSNKQSRRTSIYLQTGSLLSLDDLGKNDHSSPSILSSPAITTPTIGASSSATTISPLVSEVLANTRRRSSVYQPASTLPTLLATTPVIEPSVPLLNDVQSSAVNDHNDERVSTLNGLRKFDYDKISNDFGHHQTIEQMLSRNDQNQLPISLYIRNYNEYRRHKPAEARLAARRRERAEAREIRLREIERQQKEMSNMNVNVHSDNNEDSLGSSTGVGGSSLVNYNHINNQNNEQLINSYNRCAARATPLISRESRTSSYTSSRRSSQESLEMCGNQFNVDSPRELRHYIQELEEKYRKTMSTYSQLDNEKHLHLYQIDLYRDEMEELEENYLRLQRDFKEKSRNYEQLKRDNERLQFDFKCYKDALEERERLIKEANLVIIRNCNYNSSNNNNQQRINNVKLIHRDMLAKQQQMCNDPAINGEHLVNGNVNGDNDNGENGQYDDDNDQEDDEDDDIDDEQSILLSNNLSLISKNAAILLEDVAGNTLEAKLKNLIREQTRLQSKIDDLQLELTNERINNGTMIPIGGVGGTKGDNNNLNNNHHLNSEIQAEIQREVNKMTNDLRYKLKKCEQENSTLQSTVNRLETQLTRAKSSIEQLERVEDELKLDKRKAQRELREALTKIEELESANVHLQKRIDKLKTNRNLIPSTNIYNSNVSVNGSCVNTNTNNDDNNTERQRSQSPLQSQISSYSDSDVSSTLCSSSND